MFVNKFQQLYDACIPLQKCTSKRKRDPKLPWITKGLLKVSIIKTNYIKTM